jgi:hypothetical protein
MRHEPILARGADGLSLAVVDNQRLRLTDERGREEQTVPFAHEANAGVAVLEAPQGRLVLELADNAVNLRDGTGKRLRTVTAPAGAKLMLAALSPDGRRLALGWTSPDGGRSGAAL